MKQDNLKTGIGFLPVDEVLKQRPVRLRATAMDNLMYQKIMYNDGQCRCVVRFDGRIDDQKLAVAVERSLIVTPILGYRFVYHPLRSHWQRCIRQEGWLPFRQIETRDPDYEIDRFITQPLDSEHKPQFAVWLLKSDTDYLCVKLSHFVVDAIGLLNYIRLLRNIYNRLLTDPDYMPYDYPQCERGLGQVVRSVGFPRLLKSMVHWHFPKLTWGIPAISDNYSGCAFPLRIIDKDQLAEIKARCRNKKIKFTDLMIAAYLQSLIDFLNPKNQAKLAIQLPIDLRTFLQNDTSLTIDDLSGAYFPIIRYSSGDNFEKTLRKLETSLSKAKKDQLWFGGSLFLKIITLFPTYIQTVYGRKIIMKGVSAGLAHPTFSNLGIVDPKLFEFGKLTAVDVGLYGPVPYPPNFLVSAYSFQGKLYLLPGLCPAAVDPQLVDGILDRLVKYMNLN